MVRIVRKVRKYHNHLKILATKIIINETIDGMTPGVAAAAVSPKAAAAVRRRSAAASKPKRVLSKPDRYIWGIYIALLFISVVELYSASVSEVAAGNVYGPLIRHGIFLGGGLAMVIWLQNVNYIFFKRWAWFLAIVSLGLLLFSTLCGAEINGASRAIKIAGFTIQPPEIVKLTVVLLLARVLGCNQRLNDVANSAIVTSAIIVVVFSGILWVNGLTNTLLLMGVSVAMFLIGGIPMRKLMMVAAVYAVCGLALFVVKYSSPAATEFDEAGQRLATEQVTSSGAGRQETHSGRISRFLAGVGPEDKVDDYNRQVIFANMAQANGGLIGRGPGNSRENARLPLAFSDYIFSIVVEDTGFLGGAALLLLYLCLLARAGRIAYKCKRSFPAFLIMGCAVLIVLQALVHMAIVTGLFPVSGQPLPFISKGGTSVLVMSAAIGMMLSVSRYAVTSGNAAEIKAELAELPEDMRGTNASQL